MSTNATFTWTPQAGIVAQEVWYGRLTDVGSTLPPANGWNQGANLYSATDNAANLNNLDENTVYQFLVKSHCSTGESSWATLPKYKLVCPTISTVQHTNSVDVTLSTINSSELAKIVNVITLSITDPSSGMVLNSIDFSGAGILDTLNQTFSGLSPATPYVVGVAYNLSLGGSKTTCSTKTVNTASLAPCVAPTVTISNQTSSSFTVNVAIGSSPLPVGDTYDISLNGGTTYVQTGLSSPSYTFTGVTPGTYSVVVRRNCVAGGTGVSTPLSVNIVAQLIGTVSFNSSVPNSSGANGTLYLVFTFPQPTPVPLTLYFGQTVEYACNSCPGLKCKLSNGFDLFTTDSTNQNCSSVGPGDTSYGGHPHYPWTITIPAGVTTFNSGTNVHTIDPSPTLPNIPWSNITSGGINGSRGLTDVYVHVANPSNYAANLSVVNGTNISGVTLHNV